MFTIFAHLVFWPALICNIAIWVAIITSGVRPNQILGTIWILFLGLTILMIPGIYLFGIW